MGPYAQVVAELRAGQKRSHWMWFIFPQLAGLGSSPTAQFFALRSLEEAAAFWRHPTLGARLHECFELVDQIQGRTLREIFGAPDDLKFHSCATLFGRAAPDEPLFSAALRRWWKGTEDARTLQLLGLRERS